MRCDSWWNFASVEAASGLLKVAVPMAADAPAKKRLTPILFWRYE
jgi:hypothetical protein